MIRLPPKYNRPDTPFPTVRSSDLFDWFRSRMLGGRTNHWGRISLRFSQKDFKHKSIGGLGDDWPIGYNDVKPYYDKVDRLIGVRSEEHTSELQSLMRISYAVFCLKKKKTSQLT